MAHRFLMMSRRECQVMLRAMRRRGLRVLRPPGESDGDLLRRMYRHMSGSVLHQTRSTRASVLRVCGVVDVAGSAISYRFLGGLCVLCTASFTRMDS